MRLVTYEIKTALGRHHRLGALVGETVVDLNFACAWRHEGLGHPAPYRYADAHLPATMKAFLEGGKPAMQEARQLLRDVAAAGRPEGPNEETLVHDLAAVRLLAPVPEPNSLRDFYAFEEHVKTGFAKRGEEIPKPWYEIPVYYKGNARTMIGPDAPSPWPRYTDQLDFELELACVIGREGRNIPVEQALDYVAGYTVMNDLSARDIQRKEMACRLGPAKGKDFATAIGPALVTPDEVGDLSDLPAIVRVNGEVWSESNAGNPYWSFAQMIAHLSQDETIYPGDILGSGTVGRGCGLELDRWIRPGDVVELEIARVGILRTPIGSK
ncbi:MAG: putative Fumarylacetoacetase [Cyanobacteria bacterium RYN_339]|nr:putative Fumarylacetoacetase [Cyanobacteria bacterium RYN_339]